MPEPTLSLQLSDLQTRVAIYAGWLTAGNAFSTLNTQQQFAVTDCVQSGLRRFYFPERLPNEPGSYQWSFLHLTITLDLKANATIVRLPDDFGGFEDIITCTTTGTANSMPWKLEWTNEARIRQLFQINPTMTGPPMFVAEQPLKGTGNNKGQSFQIVVYPIADVEYTLQVQYNVNPDYLTNANPYAYGGSQHTETILESCLAVYEERYDDQPQGTGPHAMAFKTRLMASVDMDRLNKPQKIGYNRDNSDWNEHGYSPFDSHWWAPASTYNGMTMT